MGRSLYITSGRAVADDPYARLSSEVRRLHKQVARSLQSAADYRSSNARDGSAMHARLTGILQLRRRRREIFGNAAFGEPAWDILLQLYDAQLQGRRECVTSLCTASGVPPTTGLRWIQFLEDRGWIQRRGDLCDHRRSCVSLTHKGVEAMECFFTQPELVEPALGQPDPGT